MEFELLHLDAPIVSKPQGEAYLRVQLQLHRGGKLTRKLIGLKSSPLASIHHVFNSYEFSRTVGTLHGLDNCKQVAGWNSMRRRRN